MLNYTVFLEQCRFVRFNGSGKEKEEYIRLAQDFGERVVVHCQIPQTRLAVIFKKGRYFCTAVLIRGPAAGCARCSGRFYLERRIRSSSEGLLQSALTSDGLFIRDTPAMPSSMALRHKHIGLKISD